MANIRAYMAINSLKGIAEDILFTPDDIIANPASSDVIHEFGFKIALQTTEGPDKIMELINSSAGIENVEINECTGEEFLAFCAEAETPAVNPDAQAAPAPAAAVNVPAANATAPVNTPASPAENQLLMPLHSLHLPQHRQKLNQRNQQNVLLLKR